MGPWPPSPDPALDDAHYLAAVGVWGLDVRRWRDRALTCPGVVP